jgi:hypothetical protein
MPRWVRSWPRLAAGYFLDEGYLVDLIWDRQRNHIGGSPLLLAQAAREERRLLWGSDARRVNSQLLNTKTFNN